MLSHAWSWSPTSHHPRSRPPAECLDSNNQIALQFPADKVSVPYSSARVLQECRTIHGLLWIIGSFVPKPISRGQDTPHPLSKGLSKGLPWPVSGAAVSPGEMSRQRTICRPFPPHSPLTI